MSLSFRNDWPIWISARQLHTEMLVGVNLGVHFLEDVSLVTFFCIEYA